jgi:protein-S-isoprenylcysteine O-methyltransferase Ste14
MLTASWLAVRATFWALAFPGFFGFFVPWRYFGLAEVVFDAERPSHVAGLALMAVGTSLLVLCIVDFARIGRGTLSPIDPPRALVVRGLYRFVRNPMYLSVTTIVLGEVLLTRSMALLGYWVVWFAVVNAFVIGYEEPALRRQFGESYDDYRRSVGRWLPRLKPR